MALTRKGTDALNLILNLYLEPKCNNHNDGISPKSFLKRCFKNYMLCFPVLGATSLTTTVKVLFTTAMTKLYEKIQAGFCHFNALYKEKLVDGQLFSPPEQK